MIVKLVLIGDPVVGKTSLRNHFFGIPFNKGYINTVGAEFSLLNRQDENNKIDENIVSKAQIWELNSQKRFETIRSQIYIGSQAVLVVYDISNPESFENLPLWIEESQRKTGIIPIVIIGNKIDIRKSATNIITTEQGMAFANTVEERFLQNKFKVPFIETSTITGERQPPKLDLDLYVNGKVYTLSLF